MLFTAAQGRCALFAGSDDYYQESAVNSSGRSRTELGHPVLKSVQVQGKMQALTGSDAPGIDHEPRQFCVDPPSCHLVF